MTATPPPGPPDRRAGSRDHAQRVLAALLEDRPDLHGAGAAANWQLGPGLLGWLVGEVPLGGRTLETGCGYSTIVLGLVSDHHVAVSPVPAEHDRIRRWCATHDVALDAVELVEAASEVHLPAATAAGRLAPGSLDMVLVDGDHAFPVPALDWYHTAPLLKVGGLMVLDDTQIRAVAEVAAFLRQDPARWRLRHRVDDAAVFEKRVPDVAAHGRWRDQPWNGEVWSFERQARQLRSQVRLRTRWRHLRGGG